MAQTGEGVISRQGMKAIGGEQGLNKVNAGNAIGGGGDNYTVLINAVDSKSFNDMLMRNPDAITAIVSKSIKKRGMIRGDIQNYTK
jgi:hypothetical protein